MTGTFRGRLLTPSSVAVVGASNDSSRTAGRPVAFLKRHGFRGEIWPVNRNRSTVQDLLAYPSLSSLPARPDHAFVVLDTEPALAALNELASLGVPCVTMLADGFSETGPVGVARERKLRALLAGTKTRVVGPNSLGVINCRTGMALTANAAFAKAPLLPGNVSVISQSGSTIGTFVSRGRARGMGFANLVSVGNEVDLSVGEIGLEILEDPKISTILLFLESIKNAATLEAFAQRASGLGKTLLAYKLGRSEIGAQLASSHTGAMMSSDRAVDALFRDLGIRRVSVFEALFEATPLFEAKFHPPQPSNRKVAVVCTTGGGGALVADQLGLRGVEIAGPTAGVRNRLAEIGVRLGAGPLIDLTLAGTRPDVMRVAVDAILAEETYAAVVAAIGSSAETYPELAVKPIAEAHASRSETAKPLAVFTVPHAYEALSLLAASGIAGFRTPEACADAIALRLAPIAPRFDLRRRLEQHARIPALSSKADSLSEAEALELFQAIGVPTIRRQLLALRDIERARDLVDGLRPPLVVKLVSADLPHKTEAGAVTLGVYEPSDISRVVAAMLRSARQYRPDARIDQVLVQEQVAPIQEAIIGFKREPAIGPLVTLGVGGIFAEIYDDIVVRRAPVCVDEAREMIADVRGLRISAGYRGRPKGDLDALAAAVAAFSRLAALDRVLEAEINPVAIRPEGDGVVAVDGLARLAMAHSQGI
jgi:acyl-CoA synthetase (NDP forming)